jgi:Protein of unknown function (DUF1499)
MTGFYERKWSSAARWCERIAMICVPYFALTILLHRFEKITTPQAIWLVAFGLAMILASLFLGVRALLDLWNNGLRGGKATVRGVIVATLLLIPFIWHGYLAVEHPLLSDVATNPYAPPSYLQAQKLREENAAAGMNQLADYTDAYAETLIADYPKLGSRRYNAGPERVLASVKALIADRSWTITATRGVPDEAPAASSPTPAADDDPEAGDDAAAKPKAGDAANADAADAEDAPELPANIEIEVVATSPVFGYKNDVVIQIVSEAEATLVDMRSSSRFGEHDFGYNARLIEKFMADLDTSLLGIAGEG